MSFEEDASVPDVDLESRAIAESGDGDMPFPPYDPRRGSQTAAIASTMAKLELKQNKLVVLEFLASTGTYEEKELRRQDILRAVTEPHGNGTTPTVPAISLSSPAVPTGIPHSRSNPTLGTVVRTPALSTQQYNNKAPLLPRDLRNIDPAFAYTRDPCLLVRRHAILIHMDPINVIILHDRCFIFKRSLNQGSLSLNEKIATARSPSFSRPRSVNMSYRTSFDLDSEHYVISEEKAIKSFVDRLQEQATCGRAGLGVASVAIESGMPFEFTAVEAALVTVCRKLEHECKLLLNNVRYHLSKITKITSGKRLDTLRRLKIDLTAQELNIVALRKALSDVLESDEDMAYMHLAKLHANPNLYSDGDFTDHEDVELLLENYLMELDSSLTKIRLLLQEIQHTEDLITLLLDAKRNQLMKLDIWITVATVSVGLGTLMTGIFGMNLRNTYENSHKAFLLTSFGILFLMASVFFIFTFYLKRMRRVQHF